MPTALTLQDNLTQSVLQNNSLAREGKKGGKQVLCVKFLIIYLYIIQVSSFFIDDSAYLETNSEGNA